MLFSTFTQDILENGDLRLDHMFIASIVSDILKVSSHMYEFARDLI